MRVWITIIAFILVGLIHTNCARKPMVTCGTGDLMNRPSIDSEILSLKTIGFGDTVTAFIRGTISSKDSTDGKILIDELSFATIGFKSEGRKGIVGVSSDEHGKYEFHIAAGTYDISINSVGYNGLEIKNVTVEAGEIKELNVLLGQMGRGSF